MGSTPLFFAQRDGPWYPTLRLLHQYPDMMAKLRADVGAIKFVLSGANIMAPGLTSPGATIHDEVCISPYHLSRCTPSDPWPFQLCKTEVRRAHTAVKHRSTSLYHF